MLKDVKFNTIIKYLTMLIVAVLFVKYSEHAFTAAGYVFNAIIPLITGLCIAYVLNIMITKLEKIYFPKYTNKLILKTKAVALILLSVLLIIGILVLVAVIVVPEFINAASAIINSIPTLIQNIKSFTENNSDKYASLMNLLNTLNIDISSISQSVLSTASLMLQGVLSSTVSIAGAFSSSLVNFVISITFAFYVLSSKRALSGNIKKVMNAFLKSKTIEKINYIVHVANVSFSSFIIGQFAEALILGVLCSLGMMLLGLPYAVSVGAFISVTALIPIVGSYIGAALGIIMIITVNPTEALIFLIFIIVLQQLENTFIYPKVVGSSIGLPGIWVFVAITIGGGLAGITGMLLSVPIAATLYKLIADKVKSKLDKGVDIN